MADTFPRFHDAARALITVAEVARESLLPRFSELRTTGLVEPTGARRRDPSGKGGAVFRFTEKGRAAL